MHDKDLSDSGSLDFEDLDHSSASFQADGTTEVSFCRPNINSKLNSENIISRDFHRSKLNHLKFQQSCVEFGESDLCGEFSISQGRSAELRPSMRRIRSSDQLDNADLQNGKGSGVRPPRRSKSTESNIDTAAPVRRGRRPAPKAKSTGHDDIAMLEMMASMKKAEALAPVNKLSALQRQRNKKELGPKKDIRRIGLAPPGNGDGIFKASVKYPSSQNTSLKQEKGIRGRRLGGLMDRMKGDSGI